MAIGDSFTASVEHIAAGGAGVLHLGGKTVFMDFTAPGDLVTGEIVEEHHRWARGEIRAILEPSAKRQTPPCPLYGRCGGCSLQHLDYETQVAEKAAIFQDALKRIGGFPELPELRVIPSPPFSYRNRLSLHCEQGRMGFLGRNRAELIPLTDCPVMDEAIRGRLRENRITPPRDARRFTCYARGTTFLEEGRGEGRVSILDRALVLEAGVFFQSNGTMLERLIADLLVLAEQADPSLPGADLYAGVGTFASFLQTRFSRLDLVEEDPRALDLARRNVTGRGHRFFALGVEAWVRAAPDKPAYGFAVVDPPRRGLSPGLRNWLVESGPPLLAYISCDSATLARDLAGLCRGGYHLESLAYYDFYPQTAHIEGLAFLRK